MDYDLEIATAETLAEYSRQNEEHKKFIKKFKKVLDK